MEARQSILTPDYRLCLDCNGSGLRPEHRDADPAWPFQFCKACGGDGELPKVTDYVFVPGPAIWGEIRKA